MSKSISRKNAEALAIRYAAFLEASHKVDNGDESARESMKTWGWLLDEIQDATGLVLLTGMARFNIKKQRRVA